MNAVSDVVSRSSARAFVADTGEWGTFAWTEHVLGAPGYRIAGGSDEIQRNIIGERVLGLPRRAAARPGHPVQRAAALIPPDAAPRGCNSRRRQWEMACPPSTRSTVPVVKLEASLAR